MYRLGDKDSGLFEATPSPEDVKKDLKKRLIRNTIYFGVIVAVFRFASTNFNDGSSMVRIS